jgi:hypothetical protein
LCDFFRSFRANLISQLSHYEKRFIELRKQQKLPASHYPTFTLENNATITTNSVAEAAGTTQDSSNPNPNGKSAANDRSNPEEVKEEDQVSQGDFYPRLLTIDSAQGQESFMVIVDGSIQHLKDVCKCHSRVLS